MDWDETRAAIWPRTEKSLRSLRADGAAGFEAGPVAEQLFGLVPTASAVGVLAGSSALRELMAVWHPHATRVMDEMRTPIDPRGPDRPLYLIGFIQLCRWAGMDVSGAEGLTGALLEQLASLSRRIPDRLTERESTAYGFVAIAAGRSDLVPAFLRSPLPTTIRGGETFQFDSHGFSLYLAASVARGALPQMFRPAWLDFVRNFPRKLEARTLTFLDLLFAAHAFHVHIEETAQTEVVARVHALTSTAPVVGTGLPAARPLAPEERAVDMQPRPSPLPAAATQMTWARTLEPIQRDRSFAMERLRKHARDFETVPRAEKFGRTLGPIAEDLAQLAIALGVDACVPIVPLFANRTVRAIDELARGVTNANVADAFGLIEKMNVDLCVGQRLPPSISALESTWLETIARARNSLLDDEMLTGSLAALASGRIDLVPVFLGGGPLANDAAPGATFPNDPALTTRYVAGWIARGAAPEVLQPAIEAISQQFPALLLAQRMKTTDLFFLLRAFAVHVLKREPSLVAIALHSRYGAPTLSASPAIPAGARAVPPPTTTAAAPHARVEPRPPPASLEWAARYVDVEGLHGGHSIFVTASGDFVAEFVGPGRSARRHHARMPDALATELQQLLAAHPLGAVQIPDRAGIPGEARQQITVWARGVEQSVSKWRGVKHAEFDTLAAWFVTRAQQLAAVSAPVANGTWDPAWRPW